MRTICDVCESAAAIAFCAADEAALCPSCDEKVHMCNKLASRHVRVGLAEPVKFHTVIYAKMHLVDGSSLCLQCDVLVHVGGKRTRGRYLLLRQRVEGTNLVTWTSWDCSLSNQEKQGGKLFSHLRLQQTRTNKITVHVQLLENDNRVGDKVESKLIDLNARPQRLHGQASSNQEQGMEMLSGSNHESVSVVPVASFKRENDK